MSWYLGNALMWLVYFPILTTLKGLLYFVPKVRERMKFEQKNLNEPGSQSFRAQNLAADLCFEFSSEGEFQQVASLIDDALVQGKRLELVFFSPSVLGLSFSSWITSSHLILVRYDLFPEFLVWSLKKNRKLKFVWVTFKKERVKNQLVSLLKRAFLYRSDYTIFATDLDYEMGKTWARHSGTYDFRIDQIKRRLEHKEEKFQRLFPGHDDFKKILESYPRNKRLILGNAWIHDLFLLKNIPHDVLLVIVPHRLDLENVQAITQMLISLGRTPSIVSHEQHEFEGSSSFLFNMKGVLCEVYADFGKAYVGGGFGQSVHSLLEPLVAGCEHLSCGPVNHRSTEFDLGQLYGQLQEVHTNQEFLAWLKEDNSTYKLHDKLKLQFEAYSRYQKEILSC
jgi:3-deoxy-D-manno-octulosonic-acid transferase